MIQILSNFRIRGSYFTAKDLEELKVEKIFQWLDIGMHVANVISKDKSHYSLLESQIYKLLFKFLKSDFIIYDMDDQLLLYTEKSCLTID